MREKWTASPRVYEPGQEKSLVPERPKIGRKTAPGRYLACSGDTYLFQIRVPAVFGKQRPLIRISLGKIPRDKAHRLAADLAAQARSLFQEIIAPDPSAAARACSGAARPSLPDFNGADTLAEIKSCLKAHLSRQDLEQIPGPRDPEWLDLARERLAEDVEQMARVAIGELLLQAANLIRHNIAADNRNSDFPTPASSPYESGDRSPGSLSSDQAASDMGSINREADKAKAPCSDNQAVVKSVAPSTARKTPAYLLDRKRVERAGSWAPNFSTVIEDYLTLRAATAGNHVKDVKTADSRLRVFLDLIGDHPVDRYEAADLQAFIVLMEDWPAKHALRRDKAAQTVLAQSRRFHHAPISEKPLRDGYVAVVRAAMRSGMTTYNYRDPFQNARLRYPSKLTRSRQTAPISAQQLTNIFRVGVQTGHMDQMMLTLLSHLTGRRLSALIYLRGRDIFEKYPGIWVAQPSDFVEINGERRRVPLKTDESRQFFVLHRFLHEIGFIEWAVTCKDPFLFPDLMRMRDHSKTASQYMQRLFAKAGVLPGRGEVFHSLRGDCIEQLRACEIDARTIRLQVGHAVGLDEHSRYGSSAIQEAKATLLANVPLSTGVDYSMFEGLDFGAISTKCRKKGVLGKTLSRQ